MKVFISWSGERSRHIATALYDWLPLVINAVEPWLSTAELDAGTRWNVDISNSLQECSIGIFCLTPENLDSTWLAFEAGAVAKAVGESLACTYLYGMEASAVRWPLAQFQAKKANKADTLGLVRSINRAADEPLLRPEFLAKAFEKWWPDLEAQLLAVPAVDTPAGSAKRDDSDVLEEILLMLRQQRRDLPRASASDGLTAYDSFDFLAELTSFMRTLDPQYNNRFKIEEVSRSNRTGAKVRMRDNRSGGLVTFTVPPDAMYEASRLAAYIRESMSHILGIQTAT